MIGKGIVKLAKELYFVFSVYVLKRRFGIENSVYREWHDRRAHRLQMVLDMEHGTNISGAF